MPTIHWTNKEIVAEFDDAEEEFGEHKSTEFLVSIVADRLGIDQERVFDALIIQAQSASPSQGDAAMTHTPGPWAINADYPRTIIAGKTMVASVTAGPDRNSMLQHYKPPADEAAANARLIAAAPETAAERDRLKAINAELVTVLKMARDFIAYCRRAHPDIQSGEGIPIDAAIAKAEPDNA